MAVQRLLDLLKYYYELVYIVDLLVLSFDYQFSRRICAIGYVISISYFSSFHRFSIKGCFSFLMISSLYYVKFSSPYSLGSIFGIYASCNVVVA